MWFKPQLFLHRAYKTHYQTQNNKSETIAGRSACTYSHSTVSAIGTCGMPKFWKQKPEFNRRTTRRQVDFKVDNSRLLDPSHVLNPFFGPRPASTDSLPRLRVSRDSAESVRVVKCWSNRPWQHQDAAFDLDPQPNYMHVMACHNMHKNLITCITRLLHACNIM